MGRKFIYIPHDIKIEMYNLAVIQHGYCVKMRPLVVYKILPSNANMVNRVYIVLLSLRIFRSLTIIFFVDSSISCLINRFTPCEKYFVHNTSKEFMI